jgi:hypothetical protein
MSDLIRTSFLVKTDFYNKIDRTRKVKEKLFLAKNEKLNFAMRVPHKKSTCLVPINQSSV